MTVTVWRAIGDELRVIFSYAGNADMLVIETVVRQVERMTIAIPGGDWCVEVIASGSDAQLLEYVKDGFRDLRSGIHRQVAIIPHVTPEVNGAVPDATFAAFSAEETA